MTDLVVFGVLRWQLILSLMINRVSPAIESALQTSAVAPQIFKGLNIIKRTPTGEIMADLSKIDSSNPNIKASPNSAASDRMSNIIQTLAANVDATVKSMATYASQIKTDGRSRQLQLAQESLERTLNDIKLTFGKGFQQLWARIWEAQHNLAASSVILNRHNWWVVAILPPQFYQDLPTLKENIDEKWLDEFVLECASDENCALLEGMIDEWTLPHFLSRMHIFKEALEAHRNGWYALTIPALVLQIEGIIRDFIQEQDGHTGFRFEPIRERFAAKFETSSKVPDDEATIADLRAIINHCNLATFEAVYDQYRPDKHIDPTTLRRHPLAHGTWPTYNTAILSTRTFLILDLVHSMLSEVIKDGIVRAELEDALKQQDK